MSKESMKLALEALETYHGYMEPLTTVFGGPRVPAEQSTTGKVEKAIKSLRQAIAKAEKQEQGEPVAWRYGALLYHDKLDALEFIRTSNDGYMLEPIYATSQLKQEHWSTTCDKPVAYDVRCDNCGGDGYDPKDNNYYCSVCEGSRFVEKMLYTTPQQRKPLTREVIDRDFHGRVDFVRQVEAAHGIIQTYPEKDKT